MSADFFLAWKYFKPKRSAVSVITLISVIGVALGVGVLIVVLAVMTGFTDKMKEKLVDTTSLPTGNSTPTSLTNKTFHYFFPNRRKQFSI